MLSALAHLYGKIANLRNHLYANGTLRSHDLGARTISIGNITAGGTGKTPLVAYVANILAERGEKVCILTRGYGRKNPKSRVLVSDGESVLAAADESGDEPYELANKLLGKAIVVADANRVAAAGWARGRFGITAFVLDDGFQHRRARRDVDIICVDASNPFGGSAMLPKGSLREPLENLLRADAAVVIESHEESRADEIDLNLRRFAPHIEIFHATKSVSAIVRLSDRQAGKFEPGTPVLAFCGIGNPASFMSTLRSEDISEVAFRSFPDHHRYTQVDVLELELIARQAGASALLTTGKDATKMGELKMTMPCFVMEIGIVFDEQEKLANLI